MMAKAIFSSETRSGAEGEGWSAVVTIDREPWRDFPATCCATYAEAVQAVREYVDEGGA